MPYLVVRTEVRPLSLNDLARVWTTGGRARDERTHPERRWQTAVADDLEAAWRLARALSSVGPVRAGRQRVKVVRLDTPTTGPLPRSPGARRLPSPGARTPVPVGTTRPLFRSVPSPTPLGTVTPPAAAHPRDSQTWSR